MLVASLGAAAALLETQPLGVRIDLDPSSTPLLPSGDPGTAAYRRAVLDFGDDEIFVIAMETDNVFTYENLSALRRLGRAIAKLPGVRSTESLVNVSIIRNDPERDLLEVRPLIQEIPREAAALAALRERALADPLLAKSVVSTDGRSAALNVRFHDWTDLELIRADVDGQLRALVAAEISGERRFYVAGRPHMKAAAHALMVRDLQRLMPLAVLVMALLLWIVTGSARGVIIPIGTVLIATLWTFGAMALWNVSLNLLTVVLGPVLIAVGSVYGVHILAHYESAALRAESSRAAADLMAATTRAPVLMAGASTVIGFGALLLTDIPAARELGAFAALGVTAVTLISLTGLPAFVALLPLRKRTDSPRAAAIGSRLDAALARLAHLASSRSRAVLAGWGLLCALAVALIPRIEIDTDYLTFFPEESRLRSDFAAVNALLAGAVPIYVVLSGEGSGTFSEPRNLRTLERVQGRFDGLAGVTHTLSVADLVRVVNRAVREGNPAEERIPDTLGEVAELMLVIPKSKCKPLSNVDHSRANLPVRTGEQGSAAVRSLVADLSTVLEEELTPPLRATITGDTVLLNQSADRLAVHQARPVGVTAVAVFAIVALVFRSLPLAAVALIPNLVPVLLFYGLLGAGLAPLSLPTSLIGSIVLGIAVDDTVHFLTRYRAGRNAGLAPAEAVIDCGRRVGRPIAITSVMLFLGFLVVALSGFATLRQFGLLIGLTVAICLTTDLLLLPAALVRARIR